MTLVSHALFDTAPLTWHGFMINYWLD